MKRCSTMLFQIIRAEVRQMFPAAAGIEKYLPSAKPVQASGRPPQPHRVAIAEPKSRKHRCSGIGNQCRIEVLEAAAANNNPEDERSSGDQAPAKGVGRVRASRLKAQLA